MLIRRSGSVNSDLNSKKFKMPDSELQIDDKITSQSARDQEQSASALVEISQVTKSFG